jgi:signal transduction histidine kinase/FixJ family two-component response regulator
MAWSGPTPLQTTKEGLLVSIQQQLAECTAALEQRNAELAINTSVQQGLAQQLDMQAMYDLVGDQLRDIFDAQVVGINIYDRQTNLVHHPYVIERGERFYLEPTPLVTTGFTPHMIRTRQPLMFNTDLAQRVTEFGSYVLGETQVSKSYLGVPLVVGDEARGVITLENLDREQAFSESDLRLLSTLASSLSVALENARLYHEVQRRAREMTALAEIGQDIAMAGDLDAVLESIATRAKELLQVRDIALFLWQADEQAFRAKVALGIYTDEIKSEPVLPGDGITGQIARNGVAEIVNYPERDSRTAVIPGTPEMEEDLEGLMCAPLRLRDRIIGMITVWRVRSAGLFEQADLDFLVSLARQAAIAIENSRLYLETKRRANQMAALDEVGRDISATLDLPTVLERIACHAKELLMSETSAVYLPEPGGRTFRAITVLGADTEAIRNDTIALGEGIIGDLARRGTAEVINDVTRDPRARLIPGTPQQEAEQLMVAPLLAGNRVGGMMAVWRSERRLPFTEDDLDFLVGLARQAAIAIENARLFEEAQHARAQAETANVAKSTFLANMSHELRTPLNAVLGFAQVMERDQGLSPRQREHLGIITNSGEHLLNLINGVLEMSKIEAGRVTLNEATFDLHDLFRSVEELFQLRAETRHLYLLFDIAPEVPRYVRGDESKLRQILINLLGNAVKFTHEGGISLRVSWRHQQAPIDRGSKIETSDSRSSILDPRSSSLVVEVADSGEGIAQDQLPHLFEAFVQASSGARIQEGTGLGLAISRQFVRLMGGDITVKSRMGAGSTFCFDVQLAPADLSELQGQGADRRVVGIDPNDRQEYRMLVVDDKLENRRLMVEWLRMTGFQVREAGNGAEALQVWEEWAPQMIWMDMRMPILDGYEATRRIKASLQGQATVVVALTASAFEHEETMVLSAGCDDFVRKPVRESLVFDKIVQHLGVRFVYEERQPATAAQDGAARLTPTHLAALPAEWVANLRQAILVADMEQVKTLIDEIRDPNPALAKELERLANQFQIDQLQLLVC